MSQEGKKEISFEEWLKMFNSEMEEFSKKTGIAVERILAMLAVREAKAAHEHFDWIYPQLKTLLKQDIRAQKKAIKEIERKYSRG